MEKNELRIGFLIFPGFPMACLTSVIEPLRAANEISGETRFRWVLVSEDGAKVTSSAGVAFDADCALSDATDLSHLLLLAAPTCSAAPSSSGILRRLSRHGTVLGAISGGVFPLVRCGVALDGPLSVHWCYASAFHAEFPRIEASSQVIEFGRRTITASGAAAAFDLALHLVESTLGEPIATEVACWFQHPMMRKSGVAQAVPILQQDSDAPLTPNNEIVSRASALFAQNLEDPISMAETADTLNITPRHLERSFKKATGQSPSRYYRALKMKAARQIVMYSNDRIQDIAAAVGYSNSGLFSRHYREAFGLTPKEDRHRINLYRVEGNLPVPSV
ncbi:MAG: helix-turn-helix domain-containing protein [Pelagimonas sp.]|jgi:transcriptional regulator GlxA family with amidase domain|nr:helix-turn-helix domain-containing protein [Pelagimonas sp.]